MTRNKSFRPGSEPFAKDEQTSPSSIHGPFSFLNPTRAHFEIKSGKQPPDKQFSEHKNDADVPDEDDSTSRVRLLWRSRDNRKGRHVLLVDQNNKSDVAVPPTTSHLPQVLQTIKRMFTYFPVWDISWLVAFIFTLGSIIWVINGFFAFLPLIRPSSEFPGENLYGAGITAFIGAVIFFEFGSILLMFEAVNENRAGCFGWVVEEMVEEGETTVRFRVHPSLDGCTHHHRNTQNLVGDGVVTSDEKAPSGMQQGENGKTWQWFPSWNALKTHYFHEIGFLASFAQFCGATIFSIAGFTALPGILNHMSQPLTDGIYWAPQIVGGTGFIISGTLYMLETQKNWYTPSLDVLGWHIAFWNLIGGIGFTLCGALGPAVGSSGAQFQASCSTFWGSCAFLIGSVLQLYESLQKNPVEEVKID